MGTSLTAASRSGAQAPNPALDPVLDAVAAVLGAGICLLDAEDRLLAWNDTYLTLFPEEADLLRPGLPLKETVRRFFETHLEPADHEIGARVGRATMFRLVPPMLVPGSEERKLRRIGRMSMRAHPPGGTERLEVIRSRLGDVPWPDRDLRITAVEAETGTFVVFDRDSGVELVLAVAASCAVPLVWPAVAINGRHYLDGGMRSTANVDLARGADVVVVLAPIPQAFSKSTSIKAQLQRTGATRWVVITPDAQATADIGRNLLDPAQRAAAARTGLRQAADEAERVRRAVG